FTYILNRQRGAGCQRFQLTDTRIQFASDMLRQGRALAQLKPSIQIHLIHLKNACFSALAMIEILTHPHPRRHSGFAALKGRQAPP
ncbi:hypothetical protein, partial [Pseudomonas sp. MWU12-2323]|uniref:hypothetical protein n=1 Tax=Pseudomonas sp. MWU12-2323 TaxID=2651296 RepID=UPI001C49B252